MVRSRLKHLLFAFAHDQVFAEVDGQVVTVAQISFHIDSEEYIDLSL